MHLSRWQSALSAQFSSVATELAVRGWSPLVFSEVLNYPCALAHVETESGEAISNRLYNAVRYHGRRH
jgi:hypothetical protein